MKFWLDTEFIEDGRTIDLLSIGMVREDGLEYYAVSADADWSKASDWVKEHVLPHLDRAVAKPRVLIREEVRALVLASGAQKPEIWGYYADYDWVVFCQLFGRMVDLPKQFPKFCRDVKQLCMDVGNPELPKQASTEHHALADARWTKEAYLFCMQKKPLIDGARETIAKLKLERRGFQVMARHLSAGIDPGFWRAAMEDGEFQRVGGDADCPDCRMAYYEHPQLPGFPTFHLVCSGDIVKT